MFFIIYIQFALFWWVIRIMKSQCRTSLVLSILVILKKLSIKTCKFWFVNRNTFFRAFSVSTIVFTQIIIISFVFKFLKTQGNNCLSFLLFEWEWMKRCILEGFSLRGVWYAGFYVILNVVIHVKTLIDSERMSNQIIFKDTDFSNELNSREHYPRSSKETRVERF